MKEAFENIYRRGDWVNSSGGTESGPGSSLTCSKEYLTFLTQFVRDNYVVSILDIGCGDFNLMRHFDFSGIRYFGIDLVDFVIESNRSRYQSDNVQFKCVDILTDDIDVSKYDLVLIKDVFQHLDNTTISRMLNKLQNANGVLITNDYTEQNCECSVGGYRPVNLCIDPFNIRGNFVFEWDSCGFYKKTFLVNHT